ncbi:MAG: MotA/TolQ/ExbB proton channel family protein [Deltaproteobacteria bacterium]|nr:MotA/TolQ/ExbB proton channel family protein [Deltaproteobacteria bacterium]
MAYRSWIRGRLRASLVGAVVFTVAAGAVGLLDPTALVITIGGGLGVTAMTFSRERIARAWQLVQAALEEPADPEDILATLKRYARIHRLEGAPALERAAAQADDPFLCAAIMLATEGRDDEGLAGALAGEVRRASVEGENARQVVLLLGKLFPAFGLIGTLIGLAHLLHNLGNATNLAAIGPGLGIAVTTTLYGAVLANVVVLPLATKLHAHLDRRHATMQLIADGTLMVQRKEYPTRIEQMLRGAFALPTRGDASSAALTLADRAA